MDGRWHPVRAAFMKDVGEIVVEDAPEPTAEPDGAILKVEACGICGTDARTFAGGDPRAPSPWVLGHEPVGTLVEVGSGARLPAGVQPGDRVFLGSILTCGECRWCRDGYQNLCERHELYGYDPYPGAYAEYAVVPPIAVKNLFELPPDLPSDLATVADPFACALNGAEVLDPGYGDTVMILGSGPIGCWLTLLARDRGAHRVFLSDVSEDRLRLALDVVGRFVDEAWVAGADNGTEDLLSRTGGAGAERVIVAAPSKEAQQAALVMAGRRARVVYFAGLPKADPVSPLDMNQLHYKELAVLGAYGATHRQYRITMEYLARRRDDLAPIVTHRFGLDRIEEGFATIRSGTGLKVVIEPDGDR
jgi:L-iditol 2-dehydrogenase